MKTNASRLSMLRRSLLGASAVALSLAAAGAAQAQTQAAMSASDGATVTELTVTAERRETAESVQDVPLAVNAYAGNSLQQLGVENLQDLNKIDPSLTIQTYGQVDERVIIRGISSTTGATTGIYVDEAPLEGGFNANVPGDNTPGLALHDVDHVEVLKGPQGTLFGAGSMDGTLRVITNQPQLATVGGSVEVRGATVAGGNAYFDGDGALNVPVVKDQFGLRLAAWGENGGGFVDQTIGAVTRSNVNDVHLYGGRVEALWKPTDHFSILATENYQNTRVDGSQEWTQWVGPINSPGGAPEGPFPAYQNHVPTQEPYSQTYSLTTVTLRYDLGYGNIVATGTYGNKNELVLEDTTPADCSYGLCSYLPAAYPVSFSAQSLFSDATGEVRFSSSFKGPFQITAGFYYEADRLNYNGAVIHANPANGIVPCNTWLECKNDGLLLPGEFVTPVQFANGDRRNIDQYAVYAQADYNILSNLKATFGIRYFSADINDTGLDFQDITGPCSYYNGCITTPSVTSVTHGTENQPTYNFSLLWNVTPDVGIYARAASGFRIGGVNESATIATQEGIAVPATYAPDSLWDYEIGAKGYFLDRRLFLDLTLYHIDWSNEQEDALAAGVYNYTLNVGKSTTNGVEFDANYRPIPDLMLSGSITYVDATLAQDLPASVADAGTPGLKGDRMPFVPKVSFAGQAEYDHQITDQFTGYLATDFSYHDDSFTQFRASTGTEPPDYITELPSYFLWDLRAGVRWSNYDLSVFAENVTNSAAWTGASAGLEGVLVYSPRPRTFGLRLAAKF